MKNHPPLPRPSWVCHGCRLLALAGVVLTLASLGGVDFTVAGEEFRRPFMPFVLVILAELLSRLLSRRSLWPVTPLPLGGEAPALSSARGWFLVLAATAAYVAYAGTISCRRYQTWNTGCDLAIFNQAMHQIAFLGHPFSGIKGESFFGDHFVPILYLLGPAYRAWPTAETLLWVQTLALAAGAVPVFLLARNAVGSAGWGVLAALAYLLHPALLRINVADFHEIALVPGLFLWMFYCWKTRKRLVAILLLLLIAACKEEAPLLVAFFGIYVALVEREGRNGLEIFIVGFALFWLILTQVIPFFKSGATYTYVARYGYLGKSVPEIAANLVGHPQDTLALLFSAPHHQYLRKLIAPTFLFPLLSPATLLLSVPTLVQNLLVSPDFSAHRSFSYHYSAPLVATTIIAAIYGAARLRRWAPGFFAGLARQRGLLVPLLFLYWLNVIGVSPLVKVGKMVREDRTAVVENWMRQIPEGFPLAMSANLAAHFPGRVFMVLAGAEREPGYCVAILDRQRGDPETLAGDAACREQGFRLVREEEGYRWYDRRALGR